MTETRRPTPGPNGKDATGDGAPEQEAAAGMGRRGFLSWAIAAPTLVIGTQLTAGLIGADKAEAAIPSPPEFADGYDLGDLQDDAALPTANLITVTVNTNGTASFALPRAEVGQGITTSSAMLIAEELDLPISKVRVTLADARPELVYNQLTGGSNTTRSTYLAIRTAAALARLKLIEAAAKGWNLTDLSKITTNAGVVTNTVTGATRTYGDLAVAAAASQSSPLNVQLKPKSQFTVIGKPQKRIDAILSVTGQKKFTLDLKIPNALPTMVCRPPTILNPTSLVDPVTGQTTKSVVKSVSNLSTVRAMPGITDVVVISTGVAVRGKTYGQCIDAVRALRVTWNAGTEDGKSDSDVLAELRAAEIPLVAPPNPLAKTVERDITFWFNSNSPLETGAAVADMRASSAEIWSPLKVPIVLVEDIAKKYGYPITAVKAHVITGGGSFGRHLFSDAALEAAEISFKLKKPVKLMWHRTDDFRQGRTHPAATSRVRASYLAGNVLSYEQRHTSVSTDFTHGLGEILTAMSAKLPQGNFTFAQSIWELTQTVSYQYGVTDQVLNEVDMGFNTGSMRNIYSPDARTVQELITDDLAKLHGKNPYLFRREFVKDARGRAVLDKVAQLGNWGRAMPSGTAQGIAIHNEYKGWCAALVEIDCRSATVNRTIEDAYTGPRVTKVVFAVDVGLVINPTGLEAQMQGGIMDGIAKALTSSLHLKDGHFLEGSWDNYWYTRQWNVPPKIQVAIMPSTSDSPGGAGEFGVAATMAAIACAYERATNTKVTELPINHSKPLGFTPLPTTPPIPQSPTNGLITQIS